MTSERVGWIPDELLVEVRGDDARTWLNGQITNDLKPLAPGRPVYGLVLTTKGRILSELFAIDDPEHGLLVAVPRKSWPALKEHFERYIIMEDVTLVPREELALVTVQGGTSEPGALPRARIDGGFDLVVPSSEAAARLAALGARPIDDAERERLRLRAGRPSFPADFGEHTYPQEAGLEKSAVSFQKGCYLGQEVVCMLESRGQISRRLVRLTGPRGLRAGGELTVDGQPVGTITSAIDDGEHSVGLGIVKRAHAALGAHLHAEGASVEVLGPPALG